MNITNILKERGISYASQGEHHHATKGWLNLDCPYCDSTNAGNFHLGFNLRGKYFSCWRCGPLKTYKVLHDLLGFSSSKCLELLKELGEDGDFEIKHPQVGSLTLPKGIGPLSPQHQRYLKSRGFDPEEITKLWQVRGIGPTPPYSWRLFIPIHYQGKIISWTTRSISPDAQVRYKNAPKEKEALSAKEVLYGMDYCRMAICVVEGPTDAWRIGPGAAATMGIGYSSKQLIKVGKFPLRLVCFDSEKDAQKRARKLCDDLEVLPGKTVNVVLDSKDPGSASDKEVKSLRRMLEKGR